MLRAALTYGLLIPSMDITLMNTVVYIFLSISFTMAGTDGLAV